MIGQDVSHYRILEQIGGGGMGVVYRAQDIRLGRDVALKFLPEELSLDREALERFRREARAASALNHPNICTIYEIDEHEGKPFIAMELLEGHTLKHRIGSKPIRTEQIIDLGIQIAEGLHAAHSRSVIHRDVKPLNIFITRGGQAKLLDFGLAKLMPRDGRSVSAHPAMAMAEEVLTSPGIAMGTVTYMSPEQARGEEVDARTDLFSFGLVLYEMATGRKAFAGSNPVVIIDAILNRAPVPPLDLNPDLPPELESIVTKAIERDADLRYQSAAELRTDLKRLKRHLESGGIRAGAPGLQVKAAPGARVRQRRAIWWGAAAGVATAALILGGGWLWARTRPEGKTMAAPAVERHRLTDFDGLEEFPAISPDGKSVAFVADVGGQRQIWVRLLAGGVPLQITRASAEHQFPRWSPESTSLVYFTPPPTGESHGTLWEIPALGGTSRRLASSLSGGDISHDGHYLAFFRFEKDQVELVAAARDGSNPRVLARLDPRFNYSFPRWSPDDRWIGYQRGLIFDWDVFAAPAHGGEPRNITRDGNLLNGFTWVPDGSGIVYSTAQGSTVLYLPTFNLWNVDLDGDDARQLTFGEASYIQPDMNGSGPQVAIRMGIQFDIWKYPIGVDAEDNARRGTQITRQTGQVQTPSLGPGDQELVYLSDSGGHANLWVMRLDGSEVRQITFEQEPGVRVGVPTWSPDGRHIAFVRGKAAKGSLIGVSVSVGLWLVGPDGSNLRKVADNSGWASWSADGRWLYYATLRHGPPWRAEKVRPEGGEPITVRSDSPEQLAVAPDGASLYYGVALAALNGVADVEVRVARPEGGPSRVLARISGSRIPTWQLLHPILSPDGKWLALTLNDGPTTNIWALPTAGGPMRQLIDFGQRRTFIARRVAWSSDGRSIYAAVGEGDADVVLLNGLVNM